MRRNLSAADPRRSPLLLSGSLAPRGDAGSPARADATARRRPSTDRGRERLDHHPALLTPVPEMVTDFAAEDSLVVRSRAALRAQSSTLQPADVLFGDLCPCLLGFFKGAESHHASRVGARRERPIAGTVSKEPLEGVPARRPDGRCVHLLPGTVLLDWQASRPPGRSAVSGPPHPGGRAAARCLS